MVSLVFSDFCFSQDKPYDDINLSAKSFLAQATSGLELFWDDNSKYYIDEVIPDLGTNFHYWRNAHAFDVNTDAYIRTGDELYKTRMENLSYGMYVADRKSVV